MAKSIKFYSESASVRPFGSSHMMVDAEYTDPFQIAEQINDSQVLAHMICNQKDLVSVIEHLNEKGLEDLKLAIYEFEKNEMIEWHSNKKWIQD